MNMTTSPGPDSLAAPPAVRWGHIWLMTAAVLTLLVLGVEAFCRSNGYRPYVRDSKDLWGFHRWRVPGDETRCVVFLGTSRMRAAVDLNTFRSRAGARDTRQLAVNGINGPFGMLRKLAEDERFCGIVICEMIDPLLDESRWADQSEYYEYKFNLYRFLTTEMPQSLLRNRLASFSARLPLRDVFSRWINGRGIPPPHYSESRFDRSLHLDFRFSADCRVDGSPPDRPRTP
jgi:hypothetical protein